MAQHFIQPSRGGMAYPWPFDGNLTLKNTALLVVDMQGDFCSPDGYFGRLGALADSNIAQAVPHVQKLLAVCRKLRMPIIFFREGHLPNLADLPANKLWRSERHGAQIGKAGPTGRFLIRGEPGWDIIPELTPIAGETIIDKPGKGGFYCTEFDTILRQMGIRNLIFTGATTECCVHTTLRSANDRGYECLLVEDCCGSSHLDLHEKAVSTVVLPGGGFGCVSTSEKVIDVLERLPESK